MGLSIVRALLHVARPTTCKLGNVTGTDLYRDVEQYPDSSTIPGILILQLSSTIYFANASYLRERIARWVEAEGNIIKAKGQDLQYIIFDMGGVSAIDNSGIGLLFEVHKMLESKGIKVALTNPRLSVVEKLVAADFIDVVGKEWIFLSVNDAVSSYSFTLQQAKNDDEHI